MAKLAHLEFAGVNGPVLEKFYADLLDLSFEHQDMGGTVYAKSQLCDSDQTTLGVRHEPEGKAEVVPYFEVDDLQAHIDKAVAAGGSIRIPVIDLPDGGAFCLVNDPEGNPVGLIGKNPTNSTGC